MSPNLSTGPGPTPTIGAPSLRPRIKGCAFFHGRTYLAWSRTTTIPCSESQVAAVVVVLHGHGGAQLLPARRHRHIISQTYPRRRRAHVLPHCSSPASSTAKPLTFVVYGSPTRHDGPCNRVRTSTTPPRPSVLRECVGCVGSAAEGCVAVGVTGYRPADAATINHTLNGCVRARGIVCISAGGVEARSSGRCWWALGEVWVDGKRRRPTHE